MSSNVSEGEDRDVAEFFDSMGHQFLGGNAEDGTNEEAFRAIRALVQPLFLEMHRRKIGRLVIEKEGYAAKLTMFEEGCGES